MKAAVVDTGIASHDDLVFAGGIIGVENNSIGIVGVAHEADVYAVKALDSIGSGYLSVNLK